MGEDPMDREKLWINLAKWQRGSGANLTDRTLAVAEMTLWDLAGRALHTPVWKMLGGFRDKVLAYGSTMCGDEEPDGLATPEDYANFAEWMVNRGYKAIKLHTWMPPVSWAPSVKMDIKACAAVREAVGPDFPLMLDANHWYSRMEALELGRGIQALDYYWYEEPMDEHSTESYRWLAEQLEIPIIGPEYAYGKFHTRAEWIATRACDISRVGVADVGGIGPSMKIAHLAESFNMDCEIHGGGAGNLAVIGAISNTTWYERGLLHPFIDHDEVPKHLNSIVDPMDADGNIPMPTLPGLGEDINFDYITERTIETH
jgi:L-alanine-DL-glutamate epimerase-like enolase superfamily enzyme